MIATAAPHVESVRFEPSIDTPADWTRAPAELRVMCVAPGPLFSTFDVWENAVDGLRELGVDVYPMDYHRDLSYAASIERRILAEGDQLGERSLRELTLYASHRTVAHAMAVCPHLMLFISGTIFPPPVAGLLGQHFRTALIATESPYQTVQEEYTQAFYRTAFTNERTYVERLRALRREHDHHFPDAVHYLAHAYSPARHCPRPADPTLASDVCFIGSPFPERQALFDGVNWEGIQRRLIGVYAEMSQDDTMTAPSEGVPNAEAQSFYASAAINISHHRRIRYYGLTESIRADEAESLNPRVYELAAAGAFQICDDSRPELGELFGDSIPTYRWGDSADLERVIRYWLARPTERAQLAAQARERVAPHTVAARMRAVLDHCLRKDG